MGTKEGMQHNEYGTHANMNTIYMAGDEAVCVLKPL
jgi:hypothetical protein